MHKQQEGVGVSCIHLKLILVLEMVGVEGGRRFFMDVESGVAIPKRWIGRLTFFSDAAFVVLPPQRFINSYWYRYFVK